MVICIDVRLSGSDDDKEPKINVFVEHDEEDLKHISEVRLALSRAINRLPNRLTGLSITKNERPGKAKRNS